MHYANGRPASNGDRVLQITYGSPVLGVLYNATAGNDYCNGQLAPVLPASGACLADCVHLVDVLAALGIDVTKDVRAQLALVPRKEP
jgi:hypothetical protein